MSYILDALQKSTAEGNPVVAASLLRGNAKQRKQRLIGSLIALALFANVAVLAWRFWPERVDLPEIAQLPLEVATSTAIEATEKSAPAIVPEPPPSANGSITPLETNLEPLKTITVADLPERARLSFPNIEFSTHVYAEDPTLRAVVANGLRLMEGDLFEGLELIEITPEGVIFLFQDYLITVSVLALWEEGSY